jgi:peptidoglycan/xylan/chitin deacetylase (PgdA/CDA1 family)
MGSPVPAIVALPRSLPVPGHCTRTWATRLARQWLLPGLLLSPLLRSAWAGTPLRLEDLEHLRGPLAASVIAAPAPTSWTRFEEGEDSRLAVLLTGEDPGSWLGLVEGLRALGVPLTVTRDWRRAVRHRMLLVYPTVSGRVLSGEALAGLRAQVLQGGTLVGFEVLGGAGAQLFGIGEARPGRARFALDLPGSHTSPREARVPLGSPEHPELGLGTYAYLPEAATVLARYDTDEPAMLGQTVGTGHTLVLGVDVGDLALRGYNNRQEAIARSYVNQYEPAADLLLHWIKDRYRAVEPLAVTLGSAPAGKALPVMITHDIDYARSLRNALDYLDFERAAGVRTTYFLQTKYIRDWEDVPFLDREGVALVQRLAAAGMELGSHSVAHSRVFARLPLGSGEERFPDYRPRVTDRLVCEGCTVFGELRVSRFLVGQLSGSAPLSFRAGHLSNPAVLPEAMLASGYRFGSDSTANDLLTHLPVHTHFGRGSRTELPVFEFPVTIEDEQKPPLGERVGAALALAEDVIRDEGIFVILIHPDITGHKLQFERDFVQAMQSRAWFGTVAEFGTWWAARDQVGIDLIPADPGSVGTGLRVHAPEPIDGLTLQLPPGFRLTVDKRVRSSEAGLAVLGPLQGEAEFRLEPLAAP